MESKSRLSLFRFLADFAITVLVCLGAYRTTALVASRYAVAHGLTGNWAVKTSRNDGTFSKVYFNLKQDGPKITGTIRSTQFFYTIFESSGDADSFTVTAKMRDGNSDRTVKYEGKLVGDELHMSACRRPEDKPTAADISVRWADIGFKNSVESARDLFEHKDLPMSGTEYKATVPSHGVVFLRVGK